MGADRVGPRTARAPEYSRQDDVLVADAGNSVGRARDGRYENAGDTGLETAMGGV